MLITIADVLTTEQVAAARQKLAAAEWTDGRVTAGYQAQEVKRNAQISEGSPVAREVGEIILAGLARDGRAFGNLRVALYFLGLIAGRDAAVGPLGGGEFLSRRRYLFRRQYIGNCDQHF